GDQVNGEEVSFRLWDASAGKFQTRVKINGQDLHDFQPSFVIGSFTELAHFEATNILRQDIVLNEGWNWVSFNLNSLEEQDDLDDVLQVSTVMNQVDGSSVSIFKNQYAFTQFAEIDGYNDTWIGSLTELPITDMFMIKTQKSDTIIYEGKIVNPYDVPISINAGWNWISYLGQRIMSTNDALSSLNPSSGDVIKNKSAFSMYASESLGWLGTLNSMESGHGYMLNTESNGSLIYPESSIFRISDYQLNKNQLADQFVEVNNAMYQNSMSMVAKIDLEKYSQPDLSNILAAYSDHLCLGNINATPINEEESLYFITIYGDEGYNISFKYFDQVTGDYFQAQNTLEFEANKLIGSIQDPYPIVLVDSPEDLLKAYSLDVYPNPFKEEFEVEFSLENEEIISIGIYDVTGRKVKDLYSGLLKSGLHNLDIDASDIAKGSYFIELKLNDSSFRKIIIKS
ncbi:T9SS type A sorting domain-containing protein, partial [Flavobacteriales bacterium]|nr:T9SS type A sorting domain-containing protein [Flavobacteriales bacterium]